MRLSASGAPSPPQTAGPSAATAAAAGKSKRAQIFYQLQQTLLRDTEVGTPSAAAAAAAAAPVVLRSAVLSWGWVHDAHFGGQRLLLAMNDVWRVLRYVLVHPQRERPKMPFCWWLVCGRLLALRVRSSCWRLVALRLRHGKREGGAHGQRASAIDILAYGLSRSLEHAQSTPTG